MLVTALWAERREDIAIAGALPRYTTSFVGRVADLRRLRSRAAKPGLVTLCGPGGSGKTRLAVQLASSASRSWPDGAWLVDLAAIENSSEVTSAVAAALDIPRHSADIEDLIATWLSSRRPLLILDTCEHVLRGCAELCTEMALRCPHITILATSRESLGTTGEEIWPVEPLEQADASNLFEQRARLADPQFRLTNSNRSIVSEICTMLDGMPLAVELAAARVVLLSEREILSRLGDRLGLLSSSGGTSPRRQRSITATIEWSYQLLSDEEARLFRRLSVFRGGFTVDAAEAVGADGGPISVLDLLSGLIQKSLVNVQRSDEGRTRYRLLDTMQAFAEQQLNRSGEMDLIRRKHYEFFRGALAEHIVYTFGVRSSHLALDASDEEWKALESANLWAAVTWARNRVEDIGLGLLYDMAETQHADLPRTLSLMLTLAEQFEGGDLPVKVYNRASAIALKLGDLETASRAADKAMLLAHELGDEEMLAKSFTGSGFIRVARGDPDGALPLLEEALPVLKRSSNLVSVHSVEMHIAWTKLQQGKTDEALDRLKTLVADCQSSSIELGWYLPALGWAELAAGELDSAQATFQGAIRICRDLKDRWDIVWCLEGLTAVAAIKGDDKRALTLSGAADRIKREWSLSTGSLRFKNEIGDDAIKLASARLGSVPAKVARDKGGAMGVEQVLDYAAGLARPLVESVKDPISRRWSVLSARETEIAQLVVQGLSNDEIAARLSLSRRTVEAHLDHIRTKVGARSRVEIATWVAARSTPQATSRS